LQHIDPGEYAVSCVAGRTDAASSRQLTGEDRKILVVDILGLAVPFSDFDRGVENRL